MDPVTIKTAATALNKANQLRKKYAHIASAVNTGNNIVSKYYRHPNTNAEVVYLNEEEKDDELNSAFPLESENDDASADEENNTLNENNVIKDSINKSKKLSTKLGAKYFIKKYKNIIIIGICILIIILCLIFFIGFLPNAGGILELTNNNANNEFESKDEGTDGEVTIGGDGVPYLVDDNFIHFFQYQYPNISYGYGTTIATAGCCPTAMAMILTNITGKMITPIETADFSLKNGYRVKDNGTAWDFMPAVGSAYGVNCTQISTDAATIKNYLMSGNLISMSVNPGTFSSGGHFIVLRKVTDDGRIVVADPNSEARSKMAWDINIFPREAAAAWACSK
jgi:hypothetical protein